MQIQSDTDIFNVVVTIWLPKRYFLDPCGVGSYGHVAMELPAVDNYLPFYVSFGQNNQYTKKANDKNAYAENYDCRHITIPVCRDTLVKMHDFKNEEYTDPENEIGLIRLDEYEMPSAASGRAPFSARVNPLSSKYAHNCASIVIEFLKKAGINVPIGPRYVSGVAALHLVNAGLSGYSIGILMSCCFTS